MGWFDEQIRQRVQNDDDIFADSFAQMANLVNGGKKLDIKFHNDQELAGEAIGQILNFYHVHAQEIPDNLKNLDEVLEYLLRPSGIMRRNVRLRGKWYRDATGAMLGSLKDGRVVALIPGGITNYDYIDPDTKKSVPINSRNVGEIDTDAICFYKSFPLRELGIADLCKYMFSLLKPRDYVLVIGLMAMITGIGLLGPYLTNYLYGDVLMSKSEALLSATLLTMFFAGLSGTMVSQLHTIVKNAIERRISLAVESATMMRVLSLEPSFFKDYSAGELSSRIGGVNELCSAIFEAIFSTGLSALFSLVYIFQIVKYAAALVVPAVTITVVSLVSTALITSRRVKVSREMMKEGSKESGLVYQLIGGVAKIKNAGAEKRAFAKWARQYTKTAKHRFNPELLIKLSPAISGIISMVGTLVMFSAAIGAGVNYSDYMAFSAAYGNVEGAFTALMSMAMTAAQIKPLLEMIEPVLKAVPEISENKQVVTKLSGGIEVNNVSFRYNDGMPLVLDNLSLKVRPGQY
ncbi:MAG: ABC transporter transmembrane domain-containing protein, partial [Lachnospiraceae bacterium]|nr:ABC transporter transmembrane domain-containing protein [Lachnospiraceae bacterium]